MAPTAVVVGGVQKAKSFLKEQSSTILNVVIVLVTFGSEELFKSSLFTCPCDRPTNAFYGFLFLAVPAGIVFVLGILVNTTTWRLTTGCAQRTESAGNGCERTFVYATRVIARAMVAPIAWLFIAFLDGSYYKCALSEDPCSKNNESERKSKNLVAESQMIAWILLAVIVLTSLLGLVISRACNRFTYDQDFYIQLYRAEERSHFEEHAKAQAKEMAKENVRCFFDHEEELGKEDWDAVSRLPLISPDEHKYTPLHRWVGNVEAALEEKDAATLTTNDKDGSVAPDDLEEGEENNDNDELHVQLQGEDGVKLTYVKKASGS